ncbi:MAG: hypothetical protein AAB267_07475, partial [Candidatus Desantisbacteria bacterium]
MTDLNELIKKVQAVIKNGYIIKEEIEQVKLKKYSGEDIRITDSFYSLIVFDENTEIKITRDGIDLFFRQMSEKELEGATEIEVDDNPNERTYYLKGKYDEEAKIWWESQFSPEFDYPREDTQNIPDESRAGLKALPPDKQIEAIDRQL